MGLYYSKQTPSNNVPNFLPKLGTKLVCGIVVSGLISTSALAGSNATILPNGADCVVSIDSPLTGEEFLLPLGDSSMDTDVEGIACVGEGNQLMSSYVYAIDESGSTGSGGGTGCSPILDCEKKFVKTLHSAIINAGISNEVGMVSYDSSASIKQAIAFPDSSINGIIDSLSSGGGTNCQAGLAESLNVMTAATNSSKFIIFVSDGYCGSNIQSSTIQALNNEGIVVHSVAAGTGSSCSGGLATMAAGTGGQCFYVPDPGNLPDIIGNLIGSSLDILEIEVNGSNTTAISNNDIDPDLPQQPGPICVNYNTWLQGLGVGVHDICVTAHCSDPLGVGSATQCETIEITEQRPPVAICQDLNLEADAITCMQDGDINNGSYDPNGDAITRSYSVQGPYPAGTTLVTLTVTDPHGLTDSCEATVTVNDVTPPMITIPDVAATMWPPNHKYKGFELADCGAQVVDNCDGDIDVSSVGVITSIYSDEPENVKGDGNTMDDIMITSLTSFEVRSERAGEGNGRVYGITFDVSDGSDNTSEAVCRIEVPHSQNGDAAIDDGPAYTVSP